MMKIKDVMLFSAVLLAGFAVGWTLKPGADEEIGAADDTGRYRAKRLAAESAVRIKTVTSVVTNVVKEVVTNDLPRAQGGGWGFRRGMAGFREELERLKTENPAEYAKHTNRMARLRSHMLDRAINRLNTLAAVDTTGWSKAQIEVHERYQDLIARREELIESVRFGNENVTESQRSEVWKEIGDISRQLQEVADKERNILLNKTFENLGYGKDESSELSRAVKEIFSTTQEGFGHRGRRRR
jgi:hypothetical protein